MAQEHGVPGLLSSLGDTLHDIPTVAGNLKENLPSASPPPDEHARLVFVRARASGAEAVCRVRRGMTEVAGECRFFGSEEEAVAGVCQGEVGEGDDARRGWLRAARRAGAAPARRVSGGLCTRPTEVPVLTDGLAPEMLREPGSRSSRRRPRRAASSAAAGRRRPRIDLTEGRIRTGSGPDEIRRQGAPRFPTAPVRLRRPLRPHCPPALEGAGFG